MAPNWQRTRARKRYALSRAWKTGSLTTPSRRAERGSDAGRPMLPGSQLVPAGAPHLEAQAKARTMAERPKRPLRRRVQARVMRMVNVPMRVVLGLPVATPLGGRLMLVTIIGRKTGKVYRQPLSYVRQGTTLLTPGGGKWKLNLRDDQPVPIRLRGHDILARPELVKDLDEIERLLTVMAAANRSVNAFVGIPKGH